ncbi:unnamed protein product [Rotaria sp. Silwood1]|nr:unnamed protein product [Rotaria sp. Silwood1]CAF1065952.1 unnamed protein product [Rotaria sp. Silwood1]CAF3408300.1 unnamed protein product [Rotaria sp. Silwood1]CAF3419978.1 unnamed protein product [Rotaria sp. Silwood1]CAF3435740.1 unnamed protein product [Rotaria sp. Silwood1]
MSGYPYGNPAGSYPPPYGIGNTGYPNYPPNNNFQLPPPPIPMYADNQSFAPPYGTTTPYMPGNNNYSAAPYNVSQMPTDTYGYGGSSNYPPPPPSGGQMPSPMLNQSAQQYEGFGNSQYQQPYSQEMPSSVSGGLYPHLSTPAIPSNYAGEGIASSYQSQHQHQSFYPEQQPSTILASLEQYQGTVFPASNFNVDADCHALSQAMKGAGTNERALIDIIANRSNAQRQQIKLQYKSMYGMDLIKQLAGELSGNFRETITSLFESPAHFDAWSLHQALNGGREGTLREILLTRTNSEIQAIVESYRRTYNRDLEKEISSRVRGTDFKRMLISAVQANREELSPQQIQQARQMGIESIIDRNRARQDADDLYKAGAGKWGTDEKVFNAIFARRNYYQLRATFEEYQKKYRQDIAKVIRSEFSGDIKDAYLVLISCIRDRPSFFAERIHNAVSGLGTNDSTLIRVIVTRSEIDLAQIKERYQQMYKRSLAQDVSGDTSGDYKRILLSIIK